MADLRRFLDGRTADSVGLLAALHEAADQLERAEAERDEMKATLDRLAQAEHRRFVKALIHDDEETNRHA